MILLGGFNAWFRRKKKIINWEVKHNYYIQNKTEINAVQDNFHVKLDNFGMVCTCFKVKAMIALGEKKKKKLFMDILAGSINVEISQNLLYYPIF